MQFSSVLVCRKLVIFREIARPRLIFPLTLLQTYDCRKISRFRQLQYFIPSANCVMAFQGQVFGDFEKKLLMMSSVRQNLLQQLIQSAMKYSI